MGTSERPVSGSASSSFSAIDMLAAFAGFLSIILVIVLTTIDLLLKPSWSFLSSAAYPSLTSWLDCIVFFCTIIIVLLASTKLNDLFISSKGKTGALTISILVGLASSILGILGVPSSLVFGLSALSIGLFILLWGSILSALNSTMLAFMLMLSGVLAGVLVLLDSQLSTILTYAVIAVLYLISWQSARHINTASLDQASFVTRRQSIERYVRGKGNNFALVLVGSVLGITAVLTLTIDLPMNELTLALGVSLLTAGLIIALFYQDLHFHLGNTAKRLLALIITVCLVPFLFLGSIGKLVCVCFLFIAGVVYLVLIVDSILETSRFNQISPFWLIGLEGSVFFAGVLAVLVCSATLMAFFSYGLELMIFLIVGTSSILQIYINNQAYPLFRKSKQEGRTTVEESAYKQEYEQEGAEETTVFSASWRSRIDEIAEEYRLTPRQKEIMELLIRGRDLNYIIVRLNISRPTAKTHLSNLYNKMNLHSKQELIDLMEPLKDPEEAL